MNRLLSCAFIGILAVMLWGTVIASLDRSILVAGPEIWNDPWGRVTLFDTYFAFLTVWLWIAFREPTWGHRMCWLAALLGLGSFAIAAYFLWALKALPEGTDWRSLFVPRREIEPGYGDRL